MSDDKDAARAVWGASPAGTTYAMGSEPGTRRFFETGLRARDEELYWLNEIMPFATFRGRRVLELGCGVGFDAYRFVSAGATYTGIDLTPENIDRTRAHLALFGLTAEVQEGDAEDLSFGDGVFDIVYSNGVLHHTPDIDRAMRESARVLKPGGECWVVLYHRSSIVHWITLFLYQHVLRLGFRRMSFTERLSLVEYTTSTERPLVRDYTRREVRDLMSRAGLVPRATWVRKLQAQDLPLGGRLWGWVPQRWLNRIGNRWGWYVIGRGTKPVREPG